MVKRLVLLLALAACGGGSPDGGDDSGSELEGPVVTGFATDVTSISEDDTVTFTAIVNDPGGLTDLAGGALKTADGAETYGAFAQLGPGEYELTMTWAAIHAVAPIEFTADTVMTFRAEFWDGAGHVGWRTTTVMLTCPTGVACNGACTDLADDPMHCGTCGNACPEYAVFQWIGRTCSAGTCYAPSACVERTAYADCDAVCAAQGQTCGGPLCGEISGRGQTYFFYGDEAECAAFDNAFSNYQPCDDPLQTMYFPELPVTACCCSVD